MKTLGREWRRPAVPLLLLPLLLVTFANLIGAFDWKFAAMDVLHLSFERGKRTHACEIRFVQVDWV